MSNLYPGDEVNPEEAGRLLNEQAVRLTARRAGKTTAQARAVVRQASDDILLKTFAALTHRLHVADRAKADNALELRVQRDQVEEEILRRMRG